ncbi:tRNA-splicing endonuclease protein [Halorhabdus tiamatea SARL4B]|uniref:tRNA-splicing endonuclease n=1 Tax=Halorhabdus tiamatea SARL4B TaxID=1033806 RepID=F7PK06_9EURY|nr:tRNA-intron lyase [Halorhabdus tiamatea]ERJ07536.1 tRNA-splicing endonuclease protein [Halorhabdus tiamatea SARL4B]CCQ33516.1 tRNA splicing endonuclease [Halorhabdus tiamatea SARL4B]
MELVLEGDVVRGDSEARERFYDSRGYGHVDAGGLVLAPVEAAHLLYRGDVDHVRDATSGEGLDFRALLSSAAVSEIAVLVYKDLRDRGFYLSPAREGWVDDPAGADFVVYPRGQGPWDEAVAYRVRAISERTAVSAATLGDSVLAVVDEESAITYLETSHPDIGGSTTTDLPTGVAADLLGDRVLVWEPPATLYREGFYGQPLDDETAEPLQLSLIEAAALAGQGVLDVEGGADAIVECGREVEGERFDRRLSVYRALRGRGVVPKTGYKFGADFRTYADVESVDSLGHSELLVRVLPADHAFSPRDLALDVRLAHGVRKRMVFALVAEAEADGEPRIEWLEVARLTP